MEFYDYGREEDDIAVISRTVLEDELDTTITELNDRLNEAKEFKKKLLVEKLVPGDIFLNMAGPAENGYGEIHPSWVRVQEKGAK